jgi:hypothetical protein
VLLLKKHTFFLRIGSQNILVKVLRVGVIAINRGKKVAAKFDSKRSILNTKFKKCSMMKGIQVKEKMEMFRMWQM